MRVIYTAEFVKDVEGLLKRFPPRHPNIFAHHSTIAFRPNDLEGIETGKESSLKIIGRVFDDKGDALLVENPKSTNKHPHITISCAEGIVPTYSGELLEKAIQSSTVEYLNSEEHVDVVEGYFDGTNVVIK
jgi:hypothetical protein